MAATGGAGTDVLTNIQNFTGSRLDGSLTGDAGIVIKSGTDVVYLTGVQVADLASDDFAFV